MASVAPNRWMGQVNSSGEGYQLGDVVVSSGNPLVALITPTADAPPLGGANASWETITIAEFEAFMGNQQAAFTEGIYEGPYVSGMTFKLGAKVTSADGQRTFVNRWPNNTVRPDANDPVYDVTQTGWEEIETADPNVAGTGTQLVDDSSSPYDEADYIPENTGQKFPALILADTTSDDVEWDRVAAGVSLNGGGSGQGARIPVTFKNVGTGGNDFSIVGDGSDTFDGQPGPLVLADGEAITLAWDGQSTGPGNWVSLPTDAASSAAAAAASAVDAQTAQGLAETAQADAETAQGLAEGARDDAITAKNDAESAQTAAESASTAAATAQGLAEAAQTAAESAQSDAETAQTAAELAETHAETAETNAETAFAASLAAQLVTAAIEAVGPIATATAVDLDTVQAATLSVTDDASITVINAVTGAYYIISVTAVTGGKTLTVSGAGLTGGAVTAPTMILAQATGATALTEIGRT